MNNDGELKTAKLTADGPEVTRLGFGGIPISRGDYETAEAALNRALELGITLIDTAWNYGVSQNYIGQALEDRRDEYVLISKTAQRTADEARAELEKTLEKLRTDYLDACLLHSVSDLDTYEQVMAADGALAGLRRARDEGLIRHIGVSIHRDMRVMRQAIQSGGFELVMLCFNLIDQENTAAEILPLARSRELGTLAMKALGGGSMVPDTGAGFTREEQRRAVRDLIRFVLSSTLISAVPVGFANAEEVELAVEAATMPPITPTEIEDLQRLLGRIETPFRYGQVCLRCGYCQPCPEEIPIPAVFRAADAYAGYPDAVKPVAEQMMADLDVDLSACAECGRCTEHCPAGIDIPARLRRINRAFTERDPDLLSE